MRTWLRIRIRKEKNRGRNSSLIQAMNLSQSSIWHHVTNGPNKASTFYTLYSPTALWNGSFVRSGLLIRIQNENTMDMEFDIIISERKILECVGYLITCLPGETRDHYGKIHLAHILRALRS